uniref:RanBP2-type domain-containing protein n=1 Tax=Panagrellus redivivus TaxID=6233 RepID=A0A7E4V7J1_PANRE
MSDTEQRGKRILALRENLTNANTIPDRIQAHQAVVDMLDDINSQGRKENVPSSSDSAVDTEMPGKPLHKRPRRKSPAVASRIQSFPALGVENGFSGFERSSTDEGATSSSSTSKTFRRRSQSQSRLNATSLRSPRIITKPTRAQSTDNLMLTPDAKQRVFNYDFRGPIPRNHHCQRSLFGKSVDVPEDPTTAPKCTPVRKRPFKSPMSADRKPRPRQMSPAFKSTLKTSEIGQQTLHQTSCDAHRSKPTPGAVVTASKSDVSVAQRKLDEWKPREEYVLPPSKPTETGFGIPAVMKTPERHQNTRAFGFTTPKSAQSNIFTSPKTPYEYYKTPSMKMGNISSDASFTSAKEEQTPQKRSNIRRIERPGKASDDRFSDEHRKSIDAVRIAREAYTSQINQALQALTPVRDSRFSEGSPNRSQSFLRHSLTRTPDSNFVGRPPVDDEESSEEVEANLENDPPVAASKTTTIEMPTPVFSSSKSPEKPIATSTPTKPQAQSSTILRGGVKKTSLTPKKLYDDYCEWLRVYFSAKTQLLKLAAKYCDHEGLADKARRCRKEIESFAEASEKLKATAKIWCDDFTDRHINLVLDKMNGMKSDVHETLKTRDKINRKMKESRKSINFSFLGIVSVDSTQVDRVASIDRHFKTVSQMVSTKPRDPPVPTVPIPESARSQQEIESSEASQAALMVLEATRKARRDEHRALKISRKADRAERCAQLEAEIASLNAQIAALLSERRASLPVASAPILSARHLPEGSERPSLVPKLDFSSFMTPRPVEQVEKVEEKPEVVETAPEEVEADPEEEEERFETPPPPPVVEKVTPAAGDAVVLAPLTESESLTAASAVKDAVSTPSLITDVPDKVVEKPADEAPIEREPPSVFSEHRTSRDGASLGDLESLPQEAAPPSPEATENDVSTMRDIQEEAISELPKEASPIAASDEPVEAVVGTKTAPQPARSPEEDDDDHQSAQEKPASASSRDGFSAFSSLSSARNDLSDGLASLPEPASSPESTKEVPSPVKSDENEKVESPPAAITSPNSVESVQEEIEQHDEAIPSGNLSSDPERLPSSENSGIFPSGIVSSNLLEDSPVPSPPKPEPQVADETTDVPDEASKTTSVSGEASSTTSSATKSKTTDDSATSAGSTVPSSKESSARSVETVSDEAPSAVQSASSAMSSSTPSEVPSLVKLPQSMEETHQEEDVSIVEEFSAPEPAHHEEDVSLTTEDFSASITSEFNRSGRRRSYERVETGQILKRLGTSPTYQRAASVDEDVDNLSTSLEGIKLHAAPPLSPFASVSPRNSIGKSPVFNRSRNAEQRDSFGPINTSITGGGGDDLDFLNSSLGEMGRKFALFDDVELAPRVSDGKEVASWNQERSRELENVSVPPKDDSDAVPSSKVEFEPPLTIRTDDLTSKSSAFEPVKKDYNSVLIIVKEGCQSLWSQLRAVESGELDITDLKLDCKVPSSSEPDYYQAAFKKAILDTVVEVAKPLLVKGVKFADETHFCSDISKKVMNNLSIDAASDILDIRHVWNKINPSQPPMKEIEALVYESVYKFGAAEVDRIRNITYNGVVEVLKLNTPEKMDGIHRVFAKSP